MLGCIEGTEVKKVEVKEEEVEEGEEEESRKIQITGRVSIVLLLW